MTKVGRPKKYTDKWITEEMLFIDPKTGKKQTVYHDSECKREQDNPVSLANGYPPIWIDPYKSYQYQYISEQKVLLSELIPLRDWEG
jgi:hypothetical protein